MCVCVCERNQSRSLTYQREATIGETVVHARVHVTFARVPKDERLECVQVGRARRRVARDRWLATNRGEDRIRESKCH